MYTQESALAKVEARGPRWAIYGQIRPREAMCLYADTADQAEKIRDRFADDGYYQIMVHPPTGTIDLEHLGRDRLDAQAVLTEKTSILRAAVLRALEEGRSEVEVARQARVDRMTVRKWAGKG